jgi:diguanylate cyclase (GGDEF)-like protein
VSLNELVLKEIKNRKQSEQMLEAKDLACVFQPIFAVPAGNIFGYELLAQSPIENFASASKLLNKALKMWLLHPENASDGEARMFINISQLSINELRIVLDEAGKFIQQYKICPEQIVFEIKRKTSLKAYPSFCRLLDQYREQGFLIALYGFGADCSSLETIAGLQPDFIKLDLATARETLQRSVIIALIETFLSFAQKSNTTAIVEGVDSDDGFKSLVRLGVTLAQGNFLASPAFLPSSLTPESCKVLQDLRQQVDSSMKRLVVVSSIAGQGACLEASSLTSQAAVLFEQDPQRQGIVVAQQGKPLGLIMRNKLYAKLGTRFGFDLYMRRPVTEIMDREPLVLDLNTPIEAASNLAMSRKNDNIYDDMILTEGDFYFGIVSVQNLLSTITRMQLELAKAANPLTNLPGNPVIQSEITDCLLSGAKFAVIYCDLDNFKAYNDYYGFERGDQALSLVADILQKAVDGQEKAETFLGHIGGDDFVVITTPETAESLCQQVVDMFDAEIQSLYREEDRKRGYIFVQDRMGTSQWFPMMSISLAIVTNEGRNFKSHLDVAETAAELKRYAKSKIGSNYAWDRRQGQ